MLGKKFEPNDLIETRDGRIAQVVSCEYDKNNLMIYAQEVKYDPFSKDPIEGPEISVTSTSVTLIENHQKETSFEANDYLVAIDD